MPDTITTQSAVLATVPANTSVECYKDAGGVVHFPVEFITGGSPGSYTFQGVDATHGLPVSVVAGSAVIGHVIVDSGTNTIGGTTDAGAAWTSVFGVSGARFTSADQSGSAASVTDAPTSGQKIVLTDLLVSTDTNMRVDLKEQTSGTVIASLYVSAYSPVQWTPRSKTKLATANKTLQVQTSVAGNVSVTASYFSEA